jgi:hypothetical protein
MERPQVIEQTVGQEEARFGQLLDALGDVLFRESELHHIQNDLQLSRRLGESYLPTISAPAWDHALSLTENRTTINSGWWTVMIADASGHFGLTAPQDGSGAELVALYTGPADSAQVLAYDPVLGTVREVAGGPHCGQAVRGRCFEGRCHGCAAYEVYDEKSHSTGIKCVCPHQVEHR